MERSDAGGAMNPRTSGRGTVEGRRKVRPTLGRQLHQGVALLAGRELEAAIGPEVVEADSLHLVLHGYVVDARAAALDETPRLAVALGESGAPHQLEQRHAGAQLALAHLDGRQAL